MEASMNRETRRKLKITKEQADLFDRIASYKHLEDGTKVKLRYEQIIGRKDYDGLNQKYKDFVESHKESTMTVEFDEAVNKKYALVALKEDETVPKFLFWEGDLLPIVT